MGCCGGMGSGVRASWKDVEVLREARFLWGGRIWKLKQGMARVPKRMLEKLGKEGLIDVGAGQDMLGRD